jgi:NAD(P)-dependent dehydrogenase (short-subunit alcohol dehydrogenase family)
LTIRALTPILPRRTAGGNNVFSLEGRRAFVTGASGLLGGHFARVLHKAGAEVVLAARRVEACEKLAAELGSRAAAVRLDVQDETSIAGALDAGPVCDILINNAGIAATRGFLDQTAADWDSVLDINLRGAFLVGQAAAKRMVAAKSGGSIINIASVLGLRVMPGVAGYTAAKAGLIQLTRQMAVELARHSIRVNAIAPGYIASQLNAEFFASEGGQAMIRRIPQRRLGKPEDLDGALLLLASAAGAHITGSVITVDGGHSINAI